MQLLPRWMPWSDFSASKGSGSLSLRRARKESPLCAGARPGGAGRAGLGAGGRARLDCGWNRAGMARCTLDPRRDLACVQPDPGAWPCEVGGTWRERKETPSRHVGLTVQPEGGGCCPSRRLPVAGSPVGPAELRAGQRRHPGSSLGSCFLSGCPAHKGTVVRP